MSAPDRRALVDRGHGQRSIPRQCEFSTLPARASSGVYRCRRRPTMMTLQETLARFGRPEIFDTDQGSRFTSAAFSGTLAACGIRVSQDGRGRRMDNAFIERPRIQLTNRSSWSHG